MKRLIVFTLIISMAFGLSVNYVYFDGASSAQFFGPGIYYQNTTTDEVVSFEDLYQAYLSNPPPADAFSSYLPGYFTTPKDTPNLYLTSTSPSLCGSKVFQWVCEGNCSVSSDGNYLIIERTGSGPFNVTLYTNSRGMYCKNLLIGFADGVHILINGSSTQKLNNVVVYTGQNDRYGYSSTDYLGWANITNPITVNGEVGTNYSFVVYDNNFPLPHKNPNVTFDPSTTSCVTDQSHFQNIRTACGKFTWRYWIGIKLQFDDGGDVGDKFYVKELYFYRKPFFKKWAGAYYTNYIIKIGDADYSEGPFLDDVGSIIYAGHTISFQSKQNVLRNVKLFLFSPYHLPYYLSSELHIRGTAVLNLTRVDVAPYTYEGFPLGAYKVLTAAQSTELNLKYVTFTRGTERGTLNFYCGKIEDVFVSNGYETPLSLQSPADQCQHFLIKNFHVIGNISDNTHFQNAIQTSGGGDFIAYGLDVPPNSYSSAISRIYTWPGRLILYDVNEELYNATPEQIEGSWLWYPNEFWDFKAKLNFHITDKYGNPIQGVTVYAVSQTQNITYSNITNANGDASLDILLREVKTVPNDNVKMYLTRDVTTSTTQFFVDNNSAINVGDYVTLTCENYATKDYACIQWNIKGAQVTAKGTDPTYGDYINISKAPSYNPSSYPINVSKHNPAFWKVGSNGVCSQMSDLEYKPYTIYILKQGYLPVQLTYDGIKSAEWTFELVKGERGVYPFTVEMLKYDKSNAQRLNESFDVSVYAYTPEFTPKENLTCQARIYKFNDTQVYGSDGIHNMSYIGYGLYTTNFTKTDLENLNDYYLIITNCSDNTGYESYDYGLVFFGNPEYVAMVYHNYPCYFEVYENGTSKTIAGQSIDLDGKEFCIAKYYTNNSYITWEAFANDTNSSILGKVVNVKFSKENDIIGLLNQILNEVRTNDLTYILPPIALMFLFAFMMKVIGNEHFKMLFMFLAIIMGISSTFGAMLLAQNYAQKSSTWAGLLSYAKTNFVIYMLIFVGITLLIVTTYLLYIITKGILKNKFGNWRWKWGKE